MEERVYLLLNDFRHIGNVQSSTRLFDDLGFDETDRFLLTMAIEDEFSCTLKGKDADPQTLVTVGDVLRLCGKYFS